MTDAIEILKRDLLIVEKIIAIYTPRIAEPGCAQVLVKAYATRNTLTAALEVARHA